MYKTLISHGDSENLIKLALKFKDYEKVIRHYLEEGRVHDGKCIESKSYAQLENINNEKFLFVALNVLELDVTVSSKSLIFTFMPELLSMAPKETIELLKKMGNRIDSAKILPYLIFPYNSENDSEVCFYIVQLCCPAPWKFSSIYLIIFSRWKLLAI